MFLIFSSNSEVKSERSEEGAAEAAEELLPTSILTAQGQSLHFTSSLSLIKHNLLNFA